MRLKNECEFLFHCFEKGLLEAQASGDQSAEDVCPGSAEVHAGACVIDPIGPTWHLRTHPKPWVEKNCGWRRQLLFHANALSSASSYLPSQQSRPTASILSLTEK